MATNYRWFKIGEANAEIERLEKDLAAEKSKTEAAATNDSDIAIQATALKQERDALKAENDSLKSKISEVSSEADKARAEAKAATDKISDFDAKVKAEAGKLSATIVASQGATAPLKSEQSANPANPGANANPRSREAIQARFRENIAAQRKQQGF